MKVPGPALFGLDQPPFCAFLNAHFQPTAASGVSDASSAAAGAPPLHATSSSEPASPMQGPALGAKALSADAEVPAVAEPSPSNGDNSQPGRPLPLLPGAQHDSASSTDLSNRHASVEELCNAVGLPPLLAKNRFGAFAKRLQVCSAERAWAAPGRPCLAGMLLSWAPELDEPCRHTAMVAGRLFARRHKVTGVKTVRFEVSFPMFLCPQGIKAPEGPPPEDPFEPEPRPAVEQIAADSRSAAGGTSGDMANMRFDALPQGLQVNAAHASCRFCNCPCLISALPALSWCATGV